MKRILLVAVLISIVAGVIFAGLAYAAPPSTTASSSKLVGTGLAGYGGSGGQDVRYQTRILISNPNTVDTINLDMVRIYDRDGVKQYEGPFLRMFVRNYQLTPPYPVVTTLQPHQMELMRLSLWVQGVDDPTEAYTVEIFWSGGKNVLPLMGTVSQYVTQTHSDGQITQAIGEVSMENVAAR